MESLMVIGVAVGIVALVILYIQAWRYSREARRNCTRSMSMRLANLKIEKLDEYRRAMLDGKILSREEAQDLLEISTEWESICKARGDTEAECAAINMGGLVRIMLTLNEIPERRDDIYYVLLGHGPSGDRRCGFLVLGCRNLEQAICLAMDRLYSTGVSRDAYVVHGDCMGKENGFRGHFDRGTMSINHIICDSHHARHL